MPRVHPRISLSKLAEYLVVSPRRQRRIGLDAIEPRGVVVAHHRRARSAILWSARGGSVDEAKLAKSVDALRAMKPKGKWDKDDLENSVAAIESFLLLHARLSLGSSVLHPRSRSAILPIEGVAVSVVPSLVLRGGTISKPTVGAVKLYLVKNNPLTDAAGAYASTILRAFLSYRLDGAAFSVDPKLCQVVDVFSGTIFTAPRAYKQKMDDVQAACDTIRRLWLSYVEEFERERRHEPSHLRQ